jgi:hypothetical protein
LAVVLEDYLQWLPAFAATSRRPGSKLCSPLLLQSVTGAANKGHQRCYNMPLAMLQSVVGVASILPRRYCERPGAGTICRWRCYNRPPACRRRCYQRTPVLLQYAAGGAIICSVVGAATIRAPLVLLSSSSALLQSFPVGAERPGVATIRPKALPPAVAASGARRYY